MGQVSEEPRRNWVNFSDKDELSEKYHARQVAQNWTWEEYSFGGEYASSMNLDTWLREYLIAIFVVFAPIDVIVAEAGLEKNLIKSARSDEEKAYYRSQAAIEDVHTKVYRALLEAFVADEAKLRGILDREVCAKNYPEVEALLRWSEKWLKMKMATPEEQRQKDLLALACIEGILITGKFCIPVYIGTLGYCLTTVAVNDQVSKDENLHYCHAMDKYREGKPLPASLITEMVTSLVEACTQFVYKKLDPTRCKRTPDAPVAKTMITQDNLVGYYKFLANGMLVKAGLNSIYREFVKCPLPFMVKLAQDRTENFFEVPTRQYHIGTQQVVDYSVDPFADPFAVLNGMCTVSA